MIACRPFHSIAFTGATRVFLRVFLMLAALSWLVSADGQVKRKIKRGRRNKSEAQYVLDPGGWQVEWEFGHEKINDSLSTFVHPNFVLHYGLREGTDISVEMNVLTTKVSGYGVHKSVSGVEPISLGVDHVFLKETDHRPSLIGSLQLAIPFAATGDYRASHLAPNAQLSMGRTIRKDDVASLSGGLFWDGFGTKPIYTYGLDYLFQLSKYAAKASWFGFIGAALPEHYMDLSMYWQPNDQFQVGITGGTGLSHAAHKNYISVSGQIGFGKRPTRRS
jgi:hypothetical protein